MKLKSKLLSIFTVILVLLTTIIPYIGYTPVHAEETEKTGRVVFKNSPKDYTAYRTEHSTNYAVYQIFSADVRDGDAEESKGTGKVATNIRWGGGVTSRRIVCAMR